MSQLIFAQAKSIYRQASKAQEQFNTVSGNIDSDDNTMFNNIIRAERTKFKHILRIASMLHEDYEEVVQQKVTNWYFITVRPDEKRITFADFFAKVRKFLERKCMLKYNVSFEQKGTTDDTIGHGFHVHIVANTKHRSKGECLRDAISTFGTCTDANCIQVDTTKTPEIIVKKYLLEYESNDNHKIVTKESDEKWRESIGIKSIYSEMDPPALSIKSVDRAEIPIRLTFS